MRSHRLALILASFLLTGACSTDQRTDVATGSSDARVGQLMRVAEGSSQAGDENAAADLFARANRIAPEEPAPLIGLGRSLRRLGDYESARAAYQAALDLAPDNADALFGLGLTLLRLNEPETAIQHLDVAAAMRPDDPAIFNALGVAQDLTGAHVEAQMAYIKGLKTSPDDAALNNNHALSLALEGRFDEAVDLMNRLTGKPSVSRRDRQTLALIHALAGDLDAAERVASGDLSGSELSQNIRFYRALQTLGPAERARAVLSGSIR